MAKDDGPVYALWTGVFCFWLLLMSLSIGAASYPTYGNATANTEHPPYAPNATQGQVMGGYEISAAVFTGFGGAVVLFATWWRLHGWGMTTRCIQDMGYFVGNNDTVQISGIFLAVEVGLFWLAFATGLLEGGATWQYTWANSAATNTPMIMGAFFFSMFVLCFLGALAVAVVNEPLEEFDFRLLPFLWQFAFLGLCMFTSMYMFFTSAQGGNYVVAGSFMTVLGANGLAWGSLIFIVWVFVGGYTFGVGQVAATGALALA